MGLLKTVILEMREPVVEGKGIKVFRIQEDAITREGGKSCAEIHKEIAGFLEYAKQGKVFECGKCGKKFEKTNEGWGWEDVYDDMLDDLGVQSLVQDVAQDWKVAQEQGLSGQVFLDYVSSRQNQYEDEAQVELTDEEWTVFLKVVERAVLKGKSFIRSVKESMAKRQMNSARNDHDRFIDVMWGDERVRRAAQNEKANLERFIESQEYGDQDYGLWLSDIEGGMHDDFALGLAVDLDEWLGSGKPNAYTSNFKPRNESVDPEDFMEDCPKCDGHGKVDGKKCKKCGGEGYV